MSTAVIRIERTSRLSRVEPIGIKVFPFPDYVPYSVPNVAKMCCVVAEYPDNTIFTRFDGYVSIQRMTRFFVSTNPSVFGFGIREANDTGEFAVVPYVSQSWVRDAVAFESLPHSASRWVRPKNHHTVMAVTDAMLETGFVVGAYLEETTISGIFNDENTDLSNGGTTIRATRIPADWKQGVFKPYNIDSEIYTFDDGYYIIHDREFKNALIMTEMHGDIGWSSVPLNIVLKHGIPQVVNPADEMKWFIKKIFNDEYMLYHPATSTYLQESHGVMYVKHRHIPEFALETPGYGFAGWKIHQLASNVYGFYSIFNQASGDNRHYLDYKNGCLTTQEYNLSSIDLTSVVLNGGCIRLMSEGGRLSNSGVELRVFELVDPSSDPFDWNGEEMVICYTNMTRCMTSEHLGTGYYRAAPVNLYLNRYIINPPADSIWHMKIPNASGTVSLQSTARLNAKLPHIWNWGAWVTSNTGTYYIMIIKSESGGHRFYTTNSASALAGINNVFGMVSNPTSRPDTALKVFKEILI